MKRLLPFQEEVVPLLGTRNFLLADECGLGKTFMAIEAAKRFVRGPILVACRKSAKLWWEQCIREQRAGKVLMCGPAGRGLDALVLEAAERTATAPLWVVVHHEVFRFKRAKEQLARVKWDFVIADEAHNFKNRKAKQTRGFWACTLKARRRIALTATPYGRNPADMWAILHWLYPKKYTSYWRFFEKYVEYYQPRGEVYRIVRGPKNLKDLARETAPFFLQRTKDEVGLQLPPVSDVVVPVLLEDWQAKLYRRLLQESYALLEGQEIILENALVQVVRLHQCALDPALMVEDEGSGLARIPAKVAWLSSWLEDNPREPVVIVSRYRKFVEKWLRWMPNFACIVGGMSEKQAEVELKKFEETGRLCGSLDALAEGLNLQRASTLIITDGTYSPTKAVQIRDRIHRIGQERPCQIIHLEGVLPPLPHNRGSRRTVDHLVRTSVERRLTQAEMLREFVEEVKRESRASNRSL